MNYVEGLTSVEGGYGRTGSRSPMLWDDTKNAGFSTADTDKLYVKQDNSPNRATAKSEKADENSLQNEIKKLIAIRKSHCAMLSKGEIEFIKSDNYPLVYLRKSDDEKILVVINPSNREAEFEYSKTPQSVIYHFGRIAEFDGKSVKVPPCSAGFYLL